MKHLVTLTLFICSLACCGQSPSVEIVETPVPETSTNGIQSKFKSVLQFSAYEKGEMADFDAKQKQLIKIFRSQDSLKGIFLQKFLIRNGVDLTRISQHPDSLKIKPEGIEYILKSKTQKQ